MNIYSEPGSSVVFTARGGYDSQQERAKEILELGATYIVEKIEVGGWSSEVWLAGYSEGFNTALFDNLED